MAIAEDIATHGQDGNIQGDGGNAEHGDRKGQIRFYGTVVMVLSLAGLLGPAASFGSYLCKLAARGARIVEAYCGRQGFFPFARHQARAREPISSSCARS